LKAIVYTKYGGPEVLQIKEVDKPSKAFTLFGKGDHKGKIVITM
jgi:hypothetical protein